jgi:TetR/AcrR family transcriptional regulator, tetracycline repressor protein
MPRPPQPLLNHDSVIRAALAIIDSDGLDSFSLPVLASAMGVRAPSLYWHFKDRAEILRGVAMAIVAETRLPSGPSGDDWMEFFVKVSVSFRTAVLRHRNAAPVLFQFMPREAFSEVYERVAVGLSQAGVPLERHILILDGMERLVLGAALTEAMKPVSRRGKLFPAATADSSPQLAAALGANTLSAEQLFVETIRSFLHGAIQPARPAATRTRATARSRA